jgi:hypothetical protein
MPRVLESQSEEPRPISSGILVLGGEGYCYFNARLCCQTSSAWIVLVALGPLGSL